MNYTVEKILELRKDEAKAHNKFRKEAKEDFEFRDGDQWSEDDKAKLEQQNRPLVTFNRIGPIIDAVKGSELNNRQSIKYIPRTIDDRGINELYSSAAQWVRDECDAEEAESDAYDDSITIGLGWAEWYVDYDDDPEGKIKEIRIPPMEMRWDYNSHQKNLSDRIWDMREKWLPNEEIEARWPDASLDSQTEDSGAVESDQIHDSTESWRYEGDVSWKNERKNQSLVIHFQWKERESFYRVGDPETGRVLELSKSKFKKIEKIISARNILSVQMSRWKYREIFLVGKELLEERDVPVNMFTRIPITAKREESTNQWFGIVRAMKDPQRWANKFFSQIMHIFNANPKGGLILEKGAVEDTLDFENKWADPSGISYVADGAIMSGKIKDKPMSGYPSSLDKMLQFAISSIRDVSGMNVEMLGMADREQSGILEQERKKAALVILAPFANALRHHRKESGRVLLAFIRKYIPQNRMIRVVEKGQIKYVPFMKDDDTVKYDVIVDTAPSSPNLKQEIWGTMTQLLPMVMKAGIPIPPSLIDFSPLPESIAEDWKAYIEENSGPDPQVQQQIQKMQEEIQKLGEENKKLSDKKDLHKMNMQQKMQEFEVEKYIADQKMALERRNKDLEMAMKRDISANELKVEILDITAKYETEMAKIREKAELEKDPFELKEYTDTMVTNLSESSKANTDLMQKSREEDRNSIAELGKLVAEIGNKLNEKMDGDNKMREKIMKSIEAL